MTAHKCACGRPCPDATICPACAYELDAAIADVAGYRGLAYDLDLATARQARIERGGISRPPEVEGRQEPGTLRPTALAYDEHASEAAAELRGVLASWARLITDDTNPRRIGPTCGRQCAHDSCKATRRREFPPDTLAGIATWLRPRVGWLRYHPAGAEAHAGITEAVRTARRAVDRPAERLYAGQCDCDADLYARPESPYVTCPNEECRTVWKVEDRRVWLLDSARDVIASATDIARALSRYAVPVTPAKIRGHAFRGRLLPQDYNHRGHPLYRLGDVLDIVLSTTTKQEIAS